MELLSIEDLSEALTRAAIPCIEEFIAVHGNETFFCFAIELLAEEGYFHIGAGSVESFDPISQKYRTDYSYSDAQIEEIKWNNQEWPYFDFNYESDVWNNEWKVTEDKINNYKEYLNSLDEKEYEIKSEEFFKLFKLAGEAAFANIQKSGCLNKFKKTKDYRELVFEHHDVF